MTGSNSPITSSTSRYGCFKAAGVTLGVFGIAIVIFIIWVLSIVMNKANVRTIHDREICMQNQEAIMGALNRYATKNDRYPDNLEDVYPDFLQQRDVFHCPKDKASRGTVSYEYHRPAIDSPGSMIVLVCKRHSMIDGTPLVLSAVRKDETRAKPTPLEDTPYAPKRR